MNWESSRQGNGLMWIMPGEKVSASSRLFFRIVNDTHAFAPEGERAQLAEGVIPLRRGGLPCCDMFRDVVGLDGVKALLRLDDNFLGDAVFEDDGFRKSGFARDD